MGRLALTILLCAAAAAALCQGAYEEAEWPMPATTAVGSPSPWHWGEVVGVAATGRGTVLLLHRGAAPIMEFEASGEFLRAWGDGMISAGKVTLVPPEHRALGASGYAAVYGPAGCHSCGAHSIRVDPRGNIWVADAGGHIVIKMNAQGRVLMQLGEKGVSGADRSHFNLPTDVAFAPGGDIYVSDGYGNARIVKFSSNGEYLLEWGSRGTGPGEFGLPHNLVTDARGRVYVTDRDNRRIQVFDANGAFLAQWPAVGPVSALFMARGLARISHQLPAADADASRKRGRAPSGGLEVLSSTPAAPCGPRGPAGRRLDVLATKAGEICGLEIWTGAVRRGLDGAVAARLPLETGGHGVTVSETGAVYVAQLSGQVQKFVPKQ